MVNPSPAIAYDVVWTDSGVKLWFQVSSKSAIKCLYYHDIWNLARFWSDSGIQRAECVLMVRTFVKMEPTLLWEIPQRKMYFTDMFRCICLQDSPSHTFIPLLAFNSDREEEPVASVTTYHDGLSLVQSPFSPNIEITPFHHVCPSYRPLPTLTCYHYDVNWLNNTNCWLYGLNNE